MVTKKGDKRVCLRDRLLAEREVIKQRDAEITEHLKVMDKETMTKWINARIRECRVIAKQDKQSRIISETHQAQLAKVWEQIYRHDLSPEMVARAVENTNKRRSNKVLDVILADDEKDADKTFGKDNMTLRDILPD